LNRFLSDLKVSLRELFPFDFPQLGQGNRFTQIIDSPLTAFKGPFQSTVRWRPTLQTSKLEELNEKHLSIRSLMPILKDTFRGALNDLTKECSELQQLDIKEKKMAAKLNSRSKALIEQIGFFECERIRQEIESQTESDLKQTIEEFRKIFAIEDDPFSTDDMREGNIEMKMRSAIAELKRTGELSLQKYLGKIGTVKRNLHDDVDEAVSLRDLGGFAHRKFVNAVSMPRAMISVGSEDESSMSPLVDSVKHRLRKIQARREADLHNSASFLKAVLKEERRRIRSEVSAH
jgi:hypothetical protein